MRIYLIIILVSICGCTKEYTTSSTFVLSNQSGVPISIVPTSTLKDTLKILNNKTYEYTQSIERGSTPGINFAYFADGGPVRVIYDSDFIVTHYRDTLTTHPVKYLNMLSNRNFYNENSYEKIITQDTKYQRYVKLVYTFTEQDYLNIK